MSKTVEYPALRIIQTSGGSPLLLFSAPSLEIDEWAGVPQKKGDENDEETVGFQRDDDEERVQAISLFLQNPANVVQNPLLCARRGTPAEYVSFTPTGGMVSGSHGDDRPNVTAGTLRIVVDSFEHMPLLQLIHAVMKQIEARLPGLPTTVNLERVAEITAKLRRATSPEESTEQPDDSVEDESDEAMTALFTDETHVVDFWHELAVRAHALQQMSGFDGSEAAGFTREALAAFLKPIVVVDGQHRLRGAIEAARQRLRNDGQLQDEAEDLVNSGMPASSVTKSLAGKADRLIPISLVWSDDPAEHVFQFVVVNQKATPIHKALLGTILSTTLTKAETEKVRERLESAGIRLHEAQSVAYMSRNQKSPFFGKVETGMVGDGGTKLAWSVMQSLIRIFQELKGGALYHQPSRDYAQYWQQTQLLESGVVSGWEARGSASAYEDWSRGDGPWRDVFVEFFTQIRDHFSDNDPAAYNFWGNPKKSNLFNKISLTILAADFFQFMFEAKRPIDDPRDIEAAVQDWLIEVNRHYFASEWDLGGKKKDSVGIRKRWADNWEGYRRAPIKRMPSKASFGKDF